MYLGTWVVSTYFSVNRLHRDPLILSFFMATQADDEWENEIEFACFTSAQETMKKRVEGEIFHRAFCLIKLFKREKYLLSIFLPLSLLTLTIWPFMMRGRIKSSKFGHLWPAVCLCICILTALNCALFKLCQAWWSWWRMKDGGCKNLLQLQFKWRWNMLVNKIKYFIRLV